MLTTLSVLDLLLRKTYLWLPSLTLLSLLYKRYCNGLRHVPGPFMASFSNLWKLYAAWQEDMPEKNVAVHERYGPVVRTGQRTVSCSDPSALPVIYSFKAWDKVSNGYSRQDGYSDAFHIVSFLPTLRSSLSRETDSKPVGELFLNLFVYHFLLRSNVLMFWRSGLLQGTQSTISISSELLAMLMRCAQPWNWNRLST